MFSMISPEPRQPHRQGLDLDLAQPPFDGAHLVINLDRNRVVMGDEMPTLRAGEDELEFALKLPGRNSVACPTSRARNLRPIIFHAS